MSDIDRNIALAAAVERATAALNFAIRNAANAGLAIDINEVRVSATDASPDIPQLSASVMMPLTGTTPV